MIILAAVMVNVIASVVVMHKHLPVVLRLIHVLNVHLILQPVLVIIRYVLVMDTMLEHAQVNVTLDIAVHALVMVLFVRAMEIVLVVAVSAIAGIVVHVVVIVVSVAATDIMQGVIASAIVDIAVHADVMVTIVVATVINHVVVIVPDIVQVQ